MGRIQTSKKRKALFRVNAFIRQYELTGAPCKPCAHRACQKRVSLSKPSGCANDVGEEFVHAIRDGELVESYPDVCRDLEGKTIVDRTRKRDDIYCDYQCWQREIALQEEDRIERNKLTSALHDSHMFEMRHSVFAVWCTHWMNESTPAFSERMHPLVSNGDLLPLSMLSPLEKREWTRPNDDHLPVDVSERESWAWTTKTLIALHAAALAMSEWKPHLGELLIMACAAPVLILFMNRTFDPVSGRMGEQSVGEWFEFFFSEYAQGAVHAYFTSATHEFTQLPDVDTLDNRRNTASSAPEMAFRLDDALLFAWFELINCAERAKAPYTLVEWVRRRCMDSGSMFSRDLIEVHHVRALAEQLHPSHEGNGGCTIEKETKHLGGTDIFSLCQFAWRCKTNVDVLACAEPRLRSHYERIGDDGGRSRIVSNVTVDSRSWHVQRQDLARPINGHVYPVAQTEAWFTREDNKRAPAENKPSLPRPDFSKLAQISSMQRRALDIQLRYIFRPRNVIIRDDGRSFARDASFVFPPITKYQNNSWRTYRETRGEGGTDRSLLTWPHRGAHMRSAKQHWDEHGRRLQKSAGWTSEQQYMENARAEFEDWQDTYRGRKSYVMVPYHDEDVPLYGMWFADYTTTPEARKIGALSKH